MGISQEELAGAADLDRTYISSLERGLYSVSIDVLERLAKVLKVSEASLLDRTIKSGPIEPQRRPRARS